MDELDVLEEDALEKLDELITLCRQQNVARIRIAGDYLSLGFEVLEIEFGHPAYDGTDDESITQEDMN